MQTPYHENSNLKKTDTSTLMLKYNLRPKAFLDTETLNIDKNINPPVK